MGTAVFNLSGIHRIVWNRGSDYGDGCRQMRLTFADSKGRHLPQTVVLDGLQMDSWYLQEGIYSNCDQVQVIDQNLDGAQLDFGRYIVRFLRRGEVVGQHVADVLETAG